MRKHYNDDFHQQEEFIGFIGMDNDLVFTTTQVPNLIH
jgi:hypothetical protein